MIEKVWQADRNVAGADRGIARCLSNGALAQWRLGSGHPRMHSSNTMRLLTAYAKVS